MTNNQYERVRLEAERLTQQAQREGRYIVMGRTPGKSQMAYWYQLWRQACESQENKDHFEDNDDLFNV